MFVPCLLAVRFQCPKHHLVQRLQSGRMILSGLSDIPHMHASNHACMPEAGRQAGRQAGRHARRHAGKRCNQRGHAELWQGVTR